ncbi:unnamed protein product, partial [Amoebophrya sp. A120]
FLGQGAKKAPSGGQGATPATPRREYIRGRARPARKRKKAAGIPPNQGQAGAPFPVLFDCVAARSGPAGSGALVRPGAVPVLVPLSHSPCPGPVFAARLGGAGRRDGCAALPRRSMRAHFGSGGARQSLRQRRAFRCLPQWERSRPALFACGQLNTSQAWVLIPARLPILVRSVVARPPEPARQVAIYLRLAARPVCCLSIGPGLTFLLASRTHSRASAGGAFVSIVSGVASSRIGLCLSVG